MSAAKSEPKLMPFVGAPVLVRMREPINGQFEHAAMITQVNPEFLTVNAMIFPAVGFPYPIGDVPQDGDLRPLPHWRFAPNS